MRDVGEGLSQVPQASTTPRGLNALIFVRDMRDGGTIVQLTVLYVERKLEQFRTGFGGLQTAIYASAVRSPIWC